MVSLIIFLARVLRDAHIIPGEIQCAWFNSTGRLVVCHSDLPTFIRSEIEAVYHERKLFVESFTTVSEWWYEEKVSARKL